MVTNLSDKESECEYSQQVPLKNVCVDCGTSKTPLWRSSPAGPKSLCNACGVKRNRKKRRALAESNKANEKSEKKMKNRNSNWTNTASAAIGENNNSSSTRSNGCSSSSSSKDRLMAMWDVLNPQNVRVEELNEEQQAAVLLMALSHEFNCY